MKGLEMKAIAAVTNVLNSVYATATYTVQPQYTENPICPSILHTVKLDQNYMPI